MSKVATGEYLGTPRAVDTDEGRRYAQLGASKRKGTTQVVVMFEITSAGPHKGAILPWFGYFTKDAAERTVSALRLIGFSGQDILDVENQSLEGLVSLTVENEPFEGKTQSRVAWVNDPNYVPQIKMPPLTDKVKTSLKASLKGLL